MGYNIFQTFLIDSEQRLAIEIVRNLISRPSAQEFGLDLGTRHHGIAGRVHFMLQRRVLGMRERDFVGLLRTREFRFHLSTREARIHRRRACVVRRIGEDWARDETGDKEDGDQFFAHALLHSMYLRGHPVLHQAALCIARL